MVPLKKLIVPSDSQELIILSPILDAVSLYYQQRSFLWQAIESVNVLESTTYFYYKVNQIFWKRSNKTDIFNVSQNSSLVLVIYEKYLWMFCQLPNREIQYTM